MFMTGIRPSCCLFQLVQNICNPLPRGPDRYITDKQANFLPSDRVINSLFYRSVWSDQKIEVFCIHSKPLKGFILINYQLNFMKGYQLKMFFYLCTRNKQNYILIWISIYMDLCVKRFYVCAHY